MVPRPEAVTVPHSNDWHLAHDGRGGCRRVPQLEQRWMRSLCSLAPSKKKRLSWVSAGRGRLGRGADPDADGADGDGADADGAEADADADAGAAASALGRGLNLRIRKSMVATSSSFWSVYSSRWVTKCPVPRPVAFSVETESMTEVHVRRSPGTRGRT